LLYVVRTCVEVMAGHDVQCVLHVETGADISTTYTSKGGYRKEARTIKPDRIRLRGVARLSLYLPAVADYLHTY